MGKKISLNVFTIGKFSFDRIAFILTILDLMVKGVSDKWDHFDFSFQEVGNIENDHSLFKYIFSVRNLTDEELAGKSQHFITSL